MDLSFIVTGTPSNQGDLYRRQISYVTELIKRYNIQDIYTRLAAVTNGNNVRTVFDFNNQAKLKKVLALLKDLQNPGKIIGTDKATNLILDSVFSAKNGARDKVPRSVVFIVTKDTDIQTLQKNIRRMQDGGINVVMVVLGNDIDRNMFVNVLDDMKKVIFLDDSTKITDVVDKTVPVVLISEFIQIYRFSLGVYVPVFLNFLYSNWSLDCGKLTSTGCSKIVSVTKVVMERDPD